MRLRIINQNSAPQGYWDYHHPVSDIHFNRQSLKWLVKDVRIHREAMIATGSTDPAFDLRPGWQDRLFHDMCEQAGGKLPCEEVDENGKPLRKWLGVTDVRRWWNTVKEWRSQGKPLVSQQEAEERASVCRGCRHNVDVAGCEGCSGLLGEVGAFLSGMKTLKDDDLKVCDLCHCYLKAKVWLPMDCVDNEGVDFTLAPSNCWQLKVSPVPTPATP